MSEHFTCIDCGRGFTLSYAKQQWYRERDWELPKRCDDCLSHRRWERDSGNLGVSGPPIHPPARSRRRPTEFFQTPEAGQRPQARPSGQFGRGSSTWWHDPYARFGLLSLGFILLAGIAALIVGLPGWLVVLAVLLAINVVTLVLYRYDKAIAGSEQTRVPELILLALAFFGGSPAAFVAMYAFQERHKAQKTSFVILYWLIVAVQLAALCNLPLWLGWI